MALKAKVSSLDDVPEALHEFYAEDGDGFRLDAEGVEDVSGLKSTIGKQKRQITKLKAQLKPFDGIEDPDAAVAALSRVEELEQQLAAGGDEAELEKFKEALTARHQKDLDKLAKERDSMAGERDTYWGALQNALIAGGIKGAVAEAGFHPDYQKAARLELMEKGPKVVNGEDGDFQAVFVDDVGEEVGIADYVKTWSQTDDAARYMPGSGASGGGAEGGNAKRGKPGQRVIDASDSVGIARYAKEISEGTVEVR